MADYTDVPVEEETDGPGYENRIDLPPWIGCLAAPNANGSAGSVSSADLSGPAPSEVPRARPELPRRPSRPPVGRATNALRERVEASPNDWSLRRTLAEALLDSGDREGGLHELEAAMIGLERAQDLEGARSTADVIIRLNPNSVRHHQKRVEYAFRTSDRARLPEVYLELADALFRSGQADKARAVYHRVLELAPDNGERKLRSARSERSRRRAKALHSGPPRPPSPVGPRATRRWADRMTGT